MEARLFFKNKQGEDRANKDKNLFRNILVLLVSLFLVLLILINYGNILDLTASMSYALFPSKKSVEYEKLTEELIALYGSGRTEYYQDAPKNFGAASRSLSDYKNIQNTSVSNVSSENASANEILTGNYIYIPGINANAPIVSGTTTESETILNQLKQGTLMYPGSKPPGYEGDGATVIIGHSSSSIPWQKYGRIFSKLPDLTEGDLIIINYSGRKYSYNVTKIMTGSVDHLTTLNIQDDLVLGTCWPIGTDEQRIVITATLATSLDI